MGRIWDNLIRAGKLAKRIFMVGSVGLGYPPFTYAMERFGRVGKIVAGVTSLARQYFLWRDAHKPQDAGREAQNVGERPPVNQDVPIGNNL
jgi:hypothetical protein